MNNIKSIKRNSLTSETLNNILVIKYGLRSINKHFYNYDIPNDILRKVGTLESYKKFAVDDEELRVDEIESSFLDFEQ